MLRAGADPRRVGTAVVTVLFATLMSACSGSSTPRAEPTGPTSRSPAPTSPPTTRAELVIHLDWSAPLTKAPDGIDFVTDGVAAAADGSVYVVDAVEHRVRHYDARGRVIGSWGHAGNGAGEFNFQRLTETVLVSGIAIDRAGNVFVSESGAGRIQEFDRSGHFVKVVGIPAAAWNGFGRLVGVAVDDRGFVYGSDEHSPDAIQKFDAAGRFVKQWGGGGGAGHRISTGGAGPVAVAHDGTVYAPDNRASQVVVFDADGTFRSSLGSQAAAAGGLSHPMNAAIDADGVVYVSDSGNSRICTYDASGKFLGATTGEPSGPGKLESVAYVAVSSGHLFVVDDSRSLLLAFAVT
jgi:sugar lactone lactonase YvrE